MDSQQQLESTTEQLETTTVALTTTKEQLVETHQDLTQTIVERDERSFLVDEHVRSEEALLGEAEQVR